MIQASETIKIRYAALTVGVLMLLLGLPSYASGMTIGPEGV